MLIWKKHKEIINKLWVENLTVLGGIKQEM